MPSPILGAQPFSVLLTSDLRTRARAFREAQGVPLAEAIRRGLDAFLTEHGFPAANLPKARKAAGGGR